MPKSLNSDYYQPLSSTEKVDKIRRMMQRCRALINTVIVMEDYVHIDETVAAAIVRQLPFLNVVPHDDTYDELIRQYTEFMEQVAPQIEQLISNFPISIKIS
ncbi:unnamed protein product [Didymodactylos carnosus]|nr:unnamed protein product [Didymodactylos carnosus]CAF4340574.1 unnamed protein product [Didymodactylos carnosus]